MNKLHDLRLSAMADAWTAQQKDPTIGSLSFDERLALLVDIEHMARHNRELALGCSRMPSCASPTQSSRTSRHRRNVGSIDPCSRDSPPAPGSTLAILLTISTSYRMGYIL
jgi:hypothetical protein